MAGAEFAPLGWLDDAQVGRLRAQIASGTAPGEPVIISGARLRYRDVAGLAALAALVDDLAAARPVWLCHVPPDLTAALGLAGRGADWRIAPSLAIARRQIAAQTPGPEREYDDDDDQ